MKSYFKLLVLCFLFFLTLALVGCLKFNQPTTPPIPDSASLEKGNLYLEANGSPTVGKDFGIELKASSIEDLKGYSVILSYDPTILKPKEVEEGPCLSKGNETFFWKEIDSAQGTIQIDCAILGSEKSAYGDGSLATLHFKVLKKSDTEVIFSLTQTRDTRNHSILTNNKNAQVRCR